MESAIFISSYDSGKHFCGLENHTITDDDEEEHAPFTLTASIHALGDAFHDIEDHPYDNPWTSYQYTTDVSSSQEVVPPSQTVSYPGMPS